MDLDVPVLHKWTWKEITGGAYARNTSQVPAVSVKRQIRFKGTMSSPRMQHA